VSDWTKLPALEGRGNPCVCCPGIKPIISLGARIAVGFGSAFCYRDGVTVLSESSEWSACPTVADSEALALADPDHDWRIVLHGPLHGEVYQRQSEGHWVLVITDEGFA
jgi:hypothetical protein